MAQERFAGPEYYAAFDPKKWIEQIQQDGKAEERPQHPEREKDATEG